tara:strand:+ start:11 stop:730 length:720 start_codon:yes stop_codon:yes gene_type:complete
MKKDKKLKIYLGLIYLVILSIFLWVFFSKFSLSEITSYDFIKNNRNNLINIKNNSYILTLVIFILFTIIWTLLLGFAMPIMLVAGFIFGKWIGTIFSIIGLTIGATFLYLFANYFLKDLIKEKLNEKFDWLYDKFKRNEFIYLIVYRVVGGIPFQIQNILPVLFNVKIKNYFFGSLLGLAPQIFIWSSLGSGIEKIIDQNLKGPSLNELILSSEIYIPILCFIILFLIAMIIRKKFYKD